jgi:ribosomal protein S25
MAPAASGAKKQKKKWSKGKGKRILAQANSCLMGPGNNR